MFYLLYNIELCMSLSLNFLIRIKCSSIRTILPETFPQVCWSPLLFLSIVRCIVLSCGIVIISPTPRTLPIFYQLKALLVDCEIKVIIIILTMNRDELVLIYSLVDGPFNCAEGPFCHREAITYVLSTYIRYSPTAKYLPDAIPLIIIV